MLNFKVRSAVQLLSLLVLVFLIPDSSHANDEVNDSDANNSTTWDDNSTFLAENVLEPQYTALYVADKVFYVFLIRLNWMSAAEYCSSQGLVMASVDTYQDTQAMRQKLKENRLYFEEAKFWIGGCDLGHAGQYSWIGNGRPFTFTNWLPGQPDNLNNNEHCTELLYDGRWNDRDCNSPNFVICENRCPLSSYDAPIYAKKLET